MNRNTNGSRLICDGSGDGLTNPPGCIGGEFITLCVIELVDRLNQTQVSFLNQIQERQSTIQISLCDADYQTQVAFTKLFLRFFIALLHTNRQFPLFICRQQGNLSDFLQIHTDRIVRRKGFRNGGFYVDFTGFGKNDAVIIAFFVCQLFGIRFTGIHQRNSILFYPIVDFIDLLLADV